VCHHAAADGALTDPGSLLRCATAGGARMARSASSTAVIVRGTACVTGQAAAHGTLSLWAGVIVTWLSG